MSMMDVLMPVILEDHLLALLQVITNYRFHLISNLATWVASVSGTLDHFVMYMYYENTGASANSAIITLTLEVKDSNSNLLATATGIGNFPDLAFGSYETEINLLSDTPINIVKDGKICLQK